MLTNEDIEKIKEELKFTIENNKRIKEGTLFLDKHPKIKHPLRPSKSLKNH